MPWRDSRSRKAGRSLTRMATWGRTWAWYTGTQDTCSSESPHSYHHRLPLPPPLEGSTIEDEVAHIVDLYREAGRKMRAGDPADWAAHLSMPQLRVLFFLGRYGPLSVGEVAAGVGVAQPSATETLDKLVRAGLVERTPDCNDRRVVRNKLTPAGRDMIERPWEARRAVLASALRHAAPHERAAIEHGLALLCKALEKDANS